MTVSALLLHQVKSKIAATPVIAIICNKIRHLADCSMWYDQVFNCGHQCILKKKKAQHTQGHLEEIAIFQTNGKMGHCSKSKLRHWDWEKVLLYRWPRLMSSVCASLMFAVSREQTASHRVLSNEDDNSTQNMAGCRYVNHSHLVTGLFIAAFICKKSKSSHIWRITTICLQFLPHLYKIFLAHVNINPFTLHRLYLW